MTILIADDDKNIRFTLKSMLFDILGEATSIEEARNGSEFVDKCMENPPDVAFVDIQMPELDGISAVARAKKYAAATRFVILTGYSNFEYARKCVPLGVLDYVLKPVDSDTLRTILKKAQEEIYQSHKLEQSLFQTNVLTFAHYYPYIGNEIGVTDETLPPELCYVVCSFMFVFSPSARSSLPEFRHDFLTKLNAYAASSFSPDSLFAVYFTETGLMRLLVRTAAENTAERAAYHSEKFADLIGGESVAVTAAYQTAATLREAFIKNAAFEKNQFRMIIVHSGTAADADTLTGCDDECLRQIWNLRELLDAGSESEYRRELGVLSEAYASLPKNVPLSGILGYFHFAFDDTRSETIRSWNDCLRMLRSVTFSQEEGSCDLNDLIKKYIDKNFTNNLSINQIADQFSITPNYVSSLFHRKTGIKLLDYITNLRMEYAKTLLKKNPNASIKDITFMTGYSNPRYFSMLFKNYTGMLPTQYRKS